MKKNPRDRSGSAADEDRDSDLYFAYSATLRIFGAIPDFERITSTLGLEPTHIHRSGDRRSQHTAPYEHDMWSYTPPLGKVEPLHKHIDALWQALKPHKQYLLDLKNSVTVDVLLGYQSNCDNAGIDVPYTSLEMFSELKIPFGLSVIIT